MFRTLFLSSLTKCPLRVATAGAITVAVLAAGSTTKAGWDPPSIPTPNLPKPHLPPVPKPELPVLPKPPLPVPTNPIIPGVPTPPWVPPGANPTDVERYLRMAREARDQFDRHRANVQRLLDECDRYQRMAQGDDARLRAEAYRQLRSMGVMGTNKPEVQGSVTRGFGLVLWSKEFDHVEEQKFAAALAASVASGNPGPALAYIIQFAAESKRTILQNLRNAPQQARQQVETQFEKMLVAALDGAVNKGRLPVLQFGGVSLTVGLATYNHWCTVRYKMPELVATQQILGVQLYEVRFRDQERRVPLPNTHQPYVRLEVKAGVR